MKIKLFFILPLLLLFCAARPAHAQNNYYVDGCTAEVSSATSAGCSPSPAIPAGMAVAVYVRWDAGSGSLSSLIDAGGNMYTTQTPRVATVHGNQTTVLGYTCSTSSATGAITATIGTSETRVDIVVVGYRNIKDNFCLDTGAAGGADSAASGVFGLSPGSQAAAPDLQVGFLSLAADNGTAVFSVGGENTTISRGLALRQSNHQVAIGDDITMRLGTAAGFDMDSTVSSSGNSDIIEFITQGCNSDVGGGSVSSLSCTLEVRPNQIVIMPVEWRSGGTATPSDTKGLTWNTVSGSPINYDGTQWAAQYWAETGAASGADTITLTFSTAQIYSYIFPNVYDNIATSSPVDTQATATGSSTAPATGNITTTAGNDVLVTSAFAIAGETFTLGSGYSFQQGGPQTNSSTELGGVENKNSGAAGTYSGAFSMSGSSNWVAQITAFFSIQTATPSFSPPGGTYSSTQTVTISDATSGATIYYTTDGSTPTTGSTVYSSPITVASSETLKAFATAAGLTDSAVGSAAYAILISFPRHRLINN